jgi:hypothetical protein
MRYIPERVRAGLRGRLHFVLLSYAATAGLLGLVLGVLAPIQPQIGELDTSGPTAPSANAPAMPMGPPPPVVVAERAFEAPPLQSNRTAVAEPEALTAATVGLPGETPSFAITAPPPGIGLGLLAPTLVGASQLAPPTVEPAAVEAAAAPRVLLGTPRSPPDASDRATARQPEPSPVATHEDVTGGSPTPDVATVPRPSLTPEGVAPTPTQVATPEAIMPTPAASPTPEPPNASPSPSAEPEPSHPPATTSPRKRGRTPSPVPGAPEELPTPSGRANPSAAAGRRESSAGEHAAGTATPRQDGNALQARPKAEPPKPDRPHVEQPPPQPKPAKEPAARAGPERQHPKPSGPTQNDPPPAPKPPPSKNGGPKRS